MKTITFVFLFIISWAISQTRPVHGLDFVPFYSLSSGYFEVPRLGASALSDSAYDLLEQHGYVMYPVQVVSSNVQSGIVDTNQRSIVYTYVIGRDSFPGILELPLPNRTVTTDMILYATENPSILMDMDRDGIIETAYLTRQWIDKECIRLGYSIPLQYYHMLGRVTYFIPTKFYAIFKEVR